MIEHEINFYSVLKVRGVDTVIVPFRFQNKKKYSLLILLTMYCKLNNILNDIQRVESMIIFIFFWTNCTTNFRYCNFNSTTINAFVYYQNGIILEINLIVA